MSSAPAAADERCRICGDRCTLVGTKIGAWRRRPYRWLRCTRCAFVFVADPDLDFQEIYGEAYYAGRGADPLVDYATELEDPARSIRRLEWRGILDVVRSLTAVTPATRWLDYGCGNGGLVSHVRAATGCDAVGFDEGAIAREGARRGVPLLDRAELARSAGRFDVVTAIEVLEHLPEPLPVLREIFGLLRAPGLFFFTTGNSRPFRDDVLAWSYAVPEIHVSLFDPGCMELALRTAGFEPSYPGYLPGHTGVIAYKVLKNLRVKRWHPALALVPWGLVGRLLARTRGLAALPVAFKR